MLSPTRIDVAAVEYGDFQTPVSFAKKVCQKVSSFYGLQPDMILEPTFGIGNFLDGIVTTFPSVRAVIGIEINADYHEHAVNKVNQHSRMRDRIELYNADIFSYDFSYIKKHLRKEDSFLILGNPPWVTNSQLTSLGSTNLPKKSNFKGISGLDAITGKGNFDIAEYIVLQLLSEFAGYNCTLALLCKTIVAKNIIRDVDKYSFSATSIDLFAFSANEVFGVSCDAGLLVVQLGEHAKKICTVYDFETNNPIRDFGWHDGTLYANINNLASHANIDGKCQVEWRQGVKHDCCKVMELSLDDTGLFKNAMGDAYTFQLGRFVYPLVKSSDIKSFEILSTRKYVIVPQKRVNEDTSHIKVQDSLVWEYLEKYEPYLSARKSIIYKNSPKYSIFGIGDYSFSKYKIGISGFYKEPIFALIMGDIPIMMDDTCYFMSFDDVKTAIISLALLNSTTCLLFLKSIAFTDSKRPYTKEVLQRIDLEKLSEITSFDEILDFKKSLSVKCNITESDYAKYRMSLNDAQMTLF